MKKFLLLLLTLFSLTGCGHFNFSTYHEPTYDSGTATTLVSNEDEEEISSEPEEIKVYDQDDLAMYFNHKGAKNGYFVFYIEEEDYWYAHYSMGIEDNNSEEYLSSVVAQFLSYIPLYKIVEDGYLFKYVVIYDTTEANPYLVYVAVSSCFLAAVSIYSYISYGHLYVDIVIYDGQNGLYI